MNLRWLQFVHQKGIEREREAPTHTLGDGRVREGEAFNFNSSVTNNNSL